MIPAVGVSLHQSPKLLPRLFCLSHQAGAINFNCIDPHQLQFRLKLLDPNRTPADFLAGLFLSDAVHLKANNATQGQSVL